MYVATRKNQRDMIRDVQNQINLFLGTQKINPDGLIGPRTRDAYSKLTAPNRKMVEELIVSRGGVPMLFEPIKLIAKSDSPIVAVQTQGAKRINYNDFIPGTSYRWRDFTTHSAARNWRKPDSAYLIPLVNGVEDPRIVQNLIRLARVAQAMKNDLGNVFRVNSAFRNDPKSKSAHTGGNAMDITSRADSWSAEGIAVMRKIVTWTLKNVSVYDQLLMETSHPDKRKDVWLHIALSNKTNTAHRKEKLTIIQDTSTTVKRDGFYHWPEAKSIV